MAYVDGFVLLVPKKKLAAYRKMATVAGKVWKDHGAIDYRECVQDDMKVMPGCGISFLKLAKPKAGELVVFSYITYKSRAQRDAVNKKVMKDKRLEGSCDPNNMPFDVKRMTYGGFKTLVGS